MEESLLSKEKPPTLRSFDILKLNGQEYNEIKQVIESQGGNLRVFLHPFCLLHAIGSDPKVINHPRVTIADICRQATGEAKLVQAQKLSLEDYLEYRKAMKNRKCLSLCYNDGEFTPRFNNYLSLVVRILRKNPPLIFLGEEQAKLEETLKAVQELGYHGTILYYETRELDAQPYKGIERYDDIKETLHSLGVNDLLVGGEFLDFGFVKAPDNTKIVRITKNEADMDLLHCVGGLALEMASSGHFTCSISRASFPHFFPQTIK